MIYILIALLVTSMVFISGCASKDTEPLVSPTVQPTESTSYTDTPQSFYIGSLEVFPKFEAGKDLNTKATITNIGNTTNPQYKVEAFVGNKGDDAFEAPMAFGWFLAMSEEAQVAAKKQGIDTQIVRMAPPNTIGATIDPGYGMDFLFYSGENTTALVKANDGYLRFNLVIISDPYEDSASAADLLVFTVDDLPTIIESSTGKAQLGPGESIEIPLSKAGVDF